MGPTQVIRESSGCEISTIGVDAALTMQKCDENLAVLGIDAINAYNAVDRSGLYIFCCEDLLDTSTYVYNMYGGSLDVQFDAKHKIEFRQGLGQGLTTSFLFYSAIKHKVQSKVNAKMMRSYLDFDSPFQCDYIDDGLQVMHYKYIPEYVALSKSEYNNYCIGINRHKTEIILNTSNEAIIHYIQQNMVGYKYNFEDNCEYLSIPHGTEEYINEKMAKIYMKLQRKLLNIMLINDAQIRIQLLKKFMDYNKVIYQLKNCAVKGNWIKQFEEIYQFIQKSITSQLSFKNTVKYQIQMTKKRGGMGLRSPLQFIKQQKYQLFL